MQTRQVELSAECARRPVVLDGGLATELERRGHDLSSELWSARQLRDHPAAVVAAHRTFVAAGAEVVTSGSYQASFDELGDEAAQLLRRSVVLAREAEPRWVAASVGPYGAVLADGSEYRGDYGLSVAQLREWHRRRLHVLADAGADVLAVETIPCLAEVEALCAELDALGAPAWLSISCAGTATRAGEPATDAFAIARDCAAVFATGVNCTAPGDVAELVRSAAEVSGKPVVAYPNSGEGWDAERRAWSGSRGFPAADVTSWLDAGARLVGGCCRVSPEDIAAIAVLLRHRDRD
ncbi:MAG TPA: homocysteine S-methyltransferase [Jatrophihabitans sp.]|jgi:homocysteine S-methyltransferase|nr:homocysteine S-methyltransferase [Jatrophihabitans sp.]